MDARIAIVALIAVVAGCRPTADTPWHTYLNASAVADSLPDGTSAYDVYAAAAQGAARDCADYLDRSEFTGMMKAEVLAKVGPELNAIGNADGPFVYPYVPNAPFQPHEHHATWRLLGRAMAWRIEEDLDAGDHAAAIERFLTATRFGLDLMGGDAIDASLGQAIINDARLAIGPSLRSMEPTDLRAIGERLRQLLDRAPSAQSTLANEELRMMAAIQYLQDTRREHDYKDLKTLLGRDGENIAELLDSKDGDECVAYFDTLAEWATAEALALGSGAELNDIPDGAGLIGRHFLLVSRDWLPSRLVCLTRTQLLALHALVLAHERTTGRPPLSLDAMPADLLADPYTGREIGYKLTGGDFLLYSAGENGGGDLGDTDAQGLSPDLVLESAIR